ncbi:alpha/beta hydrolase fold [Pyrenophora tritici-repentis]|uniref:Alpha/beta hydrolase fold n=1 Tax=Pyrenophora tritici-repentis TaxID=45151 RepID=A0A317A8H4_9PLEO|nr:alpha/beta hydrolase fold [Pyrenophora tritici-repentis]KAI1671366.1 alpha/beta hydrolase fold [Pyrenophora tritici-repentis]KAI1685181.1 alpha/beta hydrolase fold [Pyrenophora tritici-repentis]
MEPHSRSCSTSHNGTLRLPQALLLLLRSTLAGSTSDRVTQTDSDLASWYLRDIKSTTYHLIQLFNPFVFSQGRWTLSFVGMIKLTALCGIASVLWIWNKPSGKGKAVDPQHTSDTAADDAATTDPGLLKKYSSFRSYTVPLTGFTYPRLRTFFRPHHQQDKLPKVPSPIPLLVFIHGLGGSIAQFSPILISLSNLAPCLAIDLPGCGVSSFEPKAWEAYTTEALVQLLAVVIEAHRAADEGQTVVLVGHSMGCSLAALLASPSSPQAHLLSKHVSGLIAICPKAEPPSMEEAKTLRSVSSAPAALFDLLRRWDRRGGINSKSVLRMAGADADDETKKMQLRFNQQSRSAVWLRMARGMCPDYSSGSPKGGLPRKDVWSCLDIPVFLAAGETDSVTPPSNVKQIVEFLGRDVSAIQPPSEKASLPIAAAPFVPSTIMPEQQPEEHQDSSIDTEDLPKSDDDTKTTTSTSVFSVDSSTASTDAATSSEGSITTADGPLSSPTASTSSSSTILHLHPRRLVVKTAITPKPASHALLFAPSTSRIIAGLIGTFFADYIDPRLSLAWQLSYLSTEGKWDVKNLAKWKAVTPVSDPIAGIFRAMKTLRQVDEEHTPSALTRNWKGRLCAVVDISHDNPVYDPKGLEEGGIPYHKFPTVSKQPPQPAEVAEFVQLVDQIRKEGRPGLIGVHCHYGFNRTGFFLVSYLVEREGYSVEAALDEFAKKRSPGIRHSHFIDALYVRYCKGLKRAPTL